MLFELDKKYKNITQADVKLYLNLCIPCQQKKKSQKKGIVVKPMVFNNLNSRCQIDLIDFQSQPDRDFKFICVYQDHLTTFCILNPLTSKRAEQVTRVLLDFFYLFGAPASLQSDNGREFGLRFVQFMKNKAYHSGIKRSPYNAMFGTDPKTGLTSSILPFTILQEIPSNENRKRKQTEER
ncbi:hypothetical protein QTP88_007766 [Uroleucon formosanum]